MVSLMVLMMVAALGSLVIELSKVGVMTRPACASGPSPVPLARSPARKKRLKWPCLGAPPAILSVFGRGIVPLQLAKNPEVRTPPFRCPVRPARRLWILRPAPGQPGRTAIRASESLAFDL